MATSAKSDRAFFVGMAGLLVLLAACFPLVQRLDDRTDRTRPMYEDRARMEWLQYRSVTTTGTAVPLELSAGESLEIAGEEFTPSEGVTVVVRTPAPDTFCVRVSNEYGDVSRWACLDEEKPPTDPEEPRNPDL